MFDVSFLAALSIISKERRFCRFESVGGDSAVGVTVGLDTSLSSLLGDKLVVDCGGLSCDGNAADTLADAWMEAEEAAISNGGGILRGSRAGSDRLSCNGLLAVESYDDSSYGTGGSLGGGA